MRLDLSVNKRCLKPFLWLMLINGTFLLLACMVPVVQLMVNNMFSVLSEPAPFN